MAESILDKHEFENGRIVLYRRGDIADNSNYTVRLRIPKASGYVIRSTGTADLFQARRFEVGQHVDGLHFDDHLLSLFETLKESPEPGRENGFEIEIEADGRRAAEIGRARDHIEHAQIHRAAQILEERAVTKKIPRRRDLTLDIGHL